MKNLITLIIALALSLTTFAQRWHLVENDSIIKSGTPNSYIRPNGEYVAFGYGQLSDSIHLQDGWKLEIVTEYNDSTQYLGRLYLDTISGYVKREVIDKSQEQLDAEFENRYKAENEQLDNSAIKAALRIITTPIIKSDSVTQNELDNYLYLYDEWYPKGKAYEKGDIVRYDSALWKVIIPHTSQPDWNPKVSISLFVKKQVNTGNQILNWDYPIEYWNGTDGIHEQSIVKYNGVEYKCIQSHTSQAGWTPDSIVALWGIN